MFLKELSFNSFSLGRVWSGLERSHFNSISFGKVWWSSKGTQLLTVSTLEGMVFLKETHF